MGKIQAVILEGKGFVYFDDLTPAQKKRHFLKYDRPERERTAHYARSMSESLLELIFRQKFYHSLDAGHCTNDLHPSETVRGFAEALTVLLSNLEGGSLPDVDCTCQIRKTCQRFYDNRLNWMQDVNKQRKEIKKAANRIMLNVLTNRVSNEVYNRQWAKTKLTPEEKRTNRFIWTDAYNEQDQQLDTLINATTYEEVKRVKKWLIKHHMRPYHRN